MVNLRLIRSICKSIHYRGCEKSDRKVAFEIFMKEQDIFRLAIYQFLGNHFNIVFPNGPGIYYLFDYLVDFFNETELDNKLLLAVHWDLKVLAYKVDCRALGLTEKQITVLCGESWRKKNVF